MLFNFKGGIYPDVKKAVTHKKAIEEADAPKEIILPLIQHKGSICNPIVSVGDYVKLGQRVAEGDPSDSAPIHSSVSGRVVAIEPRLCLTGENIISIVIENDFKDEEANELIIPDATNRIEADVLADVVRDAGIVGLGGSARPLSEKLLAAAKENIKTVIINGAECEPYITADSRVMIEQSEKIYDGAMLIAKALGAKEVFIAVESEKEKAISELRRVTTKKTGCRLFVLHTKYPQGDERQLVRAVTGKEIPPSGTSPDVGAFVVNVSTAAAVSMAVRKGKPLTTRVVTVSGSAVANPKNLLVRIGTPVKVIFAACGGFVEHPDKITAGGAMMGMAQYSLEAPVVKATNAVLAFCENEGKMSEKAGVCIRCGRCASVCPMRLMPIYMYKNYKLQRYDACDKLNILDCTECGSCSYICPARLPLVSSFKATKKKLKEKISEEVTEENEIQ
ncbi:MAG: electron transport complex subunit RsxC [Ruminococcaceae bacterium]|nr:electron transport complex subunit RsxC [Oscillospiraceae bacterium]